MSIEKRSNNNRSEQLNPTSQKYWKARGFKMRPENWRKIIVKTEQ